MKPRALTNGVKRLKPVEEVTACVFDYGTFLCIAEKLAETMRKVYFHSPIEREYLDVRDCVRGTGLDNVIRCDEPLSPDRLATIDLFVFPDIGYAGLQRHLRSLGKAVWGHNGGTALELYRTEFLDILEAVDLPVIGHYKAHGLTDLSDYLKKNDNKWIKIDRYRNNMETWHHTDYAQSQRMLDSMAVTFGGAKETIDFVVQDEIESDIEGGYDGWCIDGQYPPFSFQGYEKKNELYLACVMADDDLPDEIKTVNEAMSRVLRKLGYRGWWATEIRIKDGIPYFIDPTPRMPGQSGEHQLETITNFADVIWQGANGIVIEPECGWNFAAEATLHYDLKSKDPGISQEWKTIEIPESIARWVKLYHYCKIDGLYHFPSGNSDEIGVVLGAGDSVEKSIDHLTRNLDELKALPIHADVGGFTSLLDSIEEAEKQGVAFGGRVPKPEAIVKKIKHLL